MTAYVICRQCGFKIPLVIKLRSEAPILFYATSYADVVEEGAYRSVCEVCGVYIVLS
jgi:RNA polymerase-binding transcription factor DksA